MAKRIVSIDTKEIEAICLALQSGQFNELATKCISRLKKACRRIGVAAGKAKGRQLQQTVCRAISDATGVSYDPKVDGEIASRGMGQNGVDVILLGEARKKFPYSVECKQVENLNLMEAIGQAKENQIEGTDWLLVHDRKKFDEPVVSLSLSAFMKLFHR